MLTVGSGSCTDSYLYDIGTKGPAPVDRSLEVQGRFCTLGPNDVVSPIRILFAMDATQSMNRTDPTGSRAVAIVQLLQTLPQGPEPVLRGDARSPVSTSRFLTLSGLAEFEPITSYTQADLNALVNKVLVFTQGTMSPNAGPTDFIKPLKDIYALINSDLSISRTAPTQDGGLTIAPPRYVVIFLSDGAPSINEDSKLEGLRWRTSPRSPELSPSPSLSTPCTSSTPSSRCRPPAPTTSTAGCSARPSTCSKMPSGCNSWRSGAAASSATSRTTSR